MSPRSDRLPREKKKITLRILDDINDSIQKYMLMLLVTNLLVGGLTWVAFRLIGLDNAGAWALAAGLLHVVPYVGPGVTAAVTGMAAYLQFQSFSMALLASGASLAIAAFAGTVMSTWITGKIFPNESGSDLRVAAVPGEALWDCGHAAEHPDHRCREGGVATCGPFSAAGRTTGRIINRRRPAVGKAPRQ
ncbi:AI-2E family transporter [Pandoraea sputorum]|uniref:AI-2E family transporter n=1 Tax=Pandoraea sputorum TaxID=93222 RepID=UPI001CD5C7C8|nr:AI-2E family transporter [Pandoraea sputorum]